MTKPTLNDIDDLLHEATDAIKRLCKENIPVPKQKKAFEITCTVAFWPLDEWQEHDYIEMINGKSTKEFPGVISNHA